MNDGEKYDAVIIGAGSGGLSAGISLAGKGRKVLIAEKNDCPGGNCTAKNYGGYTFDLAVHQLSGISGGGVCDCILREYGMAGRVEFRRVDPFLVIDMPDRSYNLPGGEGELREELTRDFPADAGDIKRMFSGLGALKKDILIAQRLLYGSNEAMDEMIKREIGAKKILTFPFTSFAGVLLKMNLDADAFLRRWIKNPKLRSVIYSSWMYLGLPPGKISGLMMNIFFSMQYSSRSYYPAGGSQKLADAMADVFRERGGELLTNAPVKKIIIENGRALGAELEDGRRFFSGVVISNADMRHTYFDLAGRDSVPERFAKRLDDMPVSMGPFRVHLGLNCAPGSLGFEHHEHMMFTGYDHEKTYESMKRGEIEGLSLYSPANISPELAPPGGGTLILTTLLPWRTKPDWRGREEEIAEKMIRMAEKRRLPGLSKCIRVKHILTPGDLRGITNTSEGAMYGWANTPSQTLMRRIMMKSPIKGLYHVGHWTRPGTGVTTAILSGWILGKKLSGKTCTW